VGIEWGPVSLVVIDVDAHPAPELSQASLLLGITTPEAANLTGLASGVDTLALLAAYLKQSNPTQDEETLSVRTPSGLHIWYSYPHRQRRLRCSTGFSTKTALAWQVDTRAHGGYVTAPGGHVIEPPAPIPPKALPRACLSCGTAHRILKSLIAPTLSCPAAPEGTGFIVKLDRDAHMAGGLTAVGYLEGATARQQMLGATEAARPAQYARNARIVATGMAARATRPFHPEGRP
jgi:hypothetical protein